MNDIDLKALQSAVNEILRDARNEPWLRGERISWGDMTCWSARKWVDQDGDWGWTVYIDAADSRELEKHVDGELRKRGYPPMDVETEW